MIIILRGKKRGERTQNGKEGIEILEMVTREVSAEEVEFEKWSGGHEGVAVSQQRSNEREGEVAAEWTKIK